MVAVDAESDLQLSDLNKRVVNHHFFKFKSVLFAELIVPSFVTVLLVNQNFMVEKLVDIKHRHFRKQLNQGHVRINS